MKTKMTSKQVKAMFPDALKAGYCEIATLLHGYEPIAYTTGVYGWNYDVYLINGKAIVTGYRNLYGRRMNNSLEYEQKAKEISTNWDLPWPERDKQLKALQTEFFDQA